MLFYLINLLSIAATLSKSSPSTCWLTKHNIARATKNNGLCVTKDGGNLETSRALNVHEKAIGALHKALELVGPGVLFRSRVQQIDRHLYYFNIRELVRLTRT